MSHSLASLIVGLLVLTSCSLFTRKNNPPAETVAKPAPATPLDMPKETDQQKTKEDGVNQEAATTAPAVYPDTTKVGPPADEPTVTLTRKDGTPVGATDATTTDLATAEPLPAKADATVPSPDWGYDGTTGPDHWGDLKSDYMLCKEGKLQSPINLRWHKPQKPNPLTWNYKPVKAEVTDGPHALDITFDPGQIITYSGHDYDLKTAHFHSPSEHTLSGKQFPLELHFLHADETGKMAIIALFFEKGKANPLIDKILKAADSKPSEDLILSAKDFMPASHHFYRYSGSLTVPPCTEGVEWFVFNTPLEASAEQIALIRAHHAHNSRPVQELNGRTVVNF